MTTSRDLHQLIDELPETAFEAAEAFLAFLCERAVQSHAKHTFSPAPVSGQEWAATERRGLRQRQHDRDAAESGQDPDGTT